MNWSYVGSDIETFAVYAKPVRGVVSPIGPCGSTIDDRTSIDASQSGLPTATAFRRARRPHPRAATPALRRCASPRARREGCSRRRPPCRRGRPRPRLPPPPAPSRASSRSPRGSSRSRRRDGPSRRDRSAPRPRAWCSRSCAGRGPSLRIPSACRFRRLTGELVALGPRLSFGTRTAMRRDTVGHLAWPERATQ